MPADQPHLRLIDTETGEVTDHCPSCRHMEDQIDGLERDVRAWRARYADLARDQEKEAKKHPLYAKAQKLFGEWQEATGHTRAKWTHDRFKKCLPYLKSDGYDLCLLAIKGIAFDPFTKPRLNGTIKRFDDFEGPFSERRKFEEACNRAPKEALDEYKAAKQAGE